jgi:hypothetical protein
MALNSYTNLKTAIANFLARDDLTSEIDDFIDLTEADFNRRLRVRSMETVDSSFTVDQKQKHYLLVFYKLVVLYLQVLHLTKH